MNPKLFVVPVAVTSLTILGVSACATEPEVASVVEDTPGAFPFAAPAGRAPAFTHPVENTRFSIPSRSGAGFVARQVSCCDHHLLQSRVLRPCGLPQALPPVSGLRRRAGSAFGVPHRWSRAPGKRDRGPSGRTGSTIRPLPVFSSRTFR